MDNFIAIDIETTGEFPWKDDLICVGIGNEVLRPEPGMVRISEILSDPNSLVVAHTNYDLRWLILNGAPFAEGVRFHDPKVMAFMLEQNQELGLEPLAWRYLGKEIRKPIHQVKGRIMYNCAKGMGLCPELGDVPIEDVPWDEMVAYNTQDIETEAELYTHLRGLMQDSGQWELFLDEEVAFSRLLVEMEVAGMPLNENGTRQLLEEASADRAIRAQELVEATGMPSFNLKSGDQVAAYLYDELPTFKVQIEIPELKSLKPSVKNGKCQHCGSPVERETPQSDPIHMNASPPCMGSSNMRKDAIMKMLPDNVVVEKIGNVYAYGTQTIEGKGLVPPKAKWKKGKEPKRPPIDAENLALLFHYDPWVAKYLEWKSLNTLCRNYLEVWVDVMHKGRLHGRFDQARAETGRIASRDPNLQAIPVVDTPVRKLFTHSPEDDTVYSGLMIGDYSGLDARVAAHFSEDPLMLEIYRTGQDLYGVLASEAWGGPGDKSNPNRSLMKILMLSAQYGSQAKAIGDKIRISGLGDEFARKAPKLLQQLEETLPRLFEWREEELKEAQARGYITTISGRRRHLPELFSTDVWKRLRAERQVVASKVQGTSADIVRKCMIIARERVVPTQARMILQVHDEILWERGPEWSDAVYDQLVETCENAHGYSLNVGMKFEAGLGDSWEDKDAQGARSYRVMSGERS